MITLKHKKSGPRKINENDSGKCYQTCRHHFCCLSRDDDALLKGTKKKCYKVHQTYSFYETLKSSAANVKERYKWEMKILVRSYSIPNKRYIYL